MTNEQLWQSILGELEVSLSKANFTTWFKNTLIILQEDKKITVAVPNEFTKAWLENKYHKFIISALKKITKNSLSEVYYKVTTNPKKETSDNKNNITNLKQAIKETEFVEEKIVDEHGLNPKYTFDNFVVGKSNELAFAASNAVVKNPGKAYNPLFIYSGVGLGKTHLLQAIGHAIIKKNPKSKVEYLTSEQFTNQFVYSIRSGKIKNFQNKYRKVDVLIIDDIQFIAGKEKTQEEFFHTFNALYEKNKQIIISSDRSPNAISSLEDRLCSRFEGGMITDISLPDFETRIAILKTKAQEKKINIDPDVLEYIALNIKRNIRELEGALNQVAVYQRVNNCDVDIEKIKILLKSVLSSPYRKITSKKIIKCVADFYDLKESEVFQFSRKKEIVRPRQIAMFFLRQELKSSFPFIGRRFAGRDHTTAIYAYEKISKEIERDNKFKEEIELIRQLISKN